MKPRLGVPSALKSINHWDMLPSHKVRHMLAWIPLSPPMCPSRISSPASNVRHLLPSFWASQVLLGAWPTLKLGKFLPGYSSGDPVLTRLCAILAVGSWDRSLPGTMVFWMMAISRTIFRSLSRKAKMKVLPTVSSHHQLWIGMTSLSGKVLGGKGQFGGNL